MIARLWRGWTAADRADAYELLLRTTVLPGIARRGIGGYGGAELLRRPLGGEVEFVTLLWFDDFRAVEAFAGADHEAAVVPPAARALLLRFDERATHYEVREPRAQAGEG